MKSMRTAETDRREVPAMEYPRYEQMMEVNKKEVPYEGEGEAVDEHLKLADAYLACLCRKKQMEKEAKEAFPKDLVRLELEKIYSHLRERRRRTEESGRVLRLEYLERLTAMDPLLELAFLLALAPEYSDRYRHLFGSLRGEGKGVPATAGLALEAYECCRKATGEEKRRLFDLNGPFWLCLKQSEQDRERPLYLRPLEVKERVVQFLRGNSQEGSLLGEVSQTVTGREQEVYLYKDEDRKLEAVFRDMNRHRRVESSVICLIGRRGSGKHLLVSRLGKKNKRDVCLIHLSEILGREDRKEILRDIRLESLLYLNILCFDGVDCLYEQEELTARGRWFLEELTGMPGVFLFLCEEELSMKRLGSRRINIFLPPPGPRDKIMLWKKCVREYELDEDVDLDRCGSQYVLNAGEIQKVLQTAALLSAAEGRTAICSADITAAVKQHNSRMLGTYAVRINSVFTWDDLVVEEGVRRQMEHICNQIKYRSVVADDWDFYKKSPYGRGICALFYGSPGTGKTMAVQVIANELGLDLYRIDLSQMVSKYIGETEKNISSLFERAKDINALLFFDEADAFFAKRSDVSDSNDRNANAETAHLLQKLEEYEGITILATNLKENIDEAFRRRIRFMIHFRLPDPDVRRLLWHKMFPPQAPLEEDVDLDFFAEQFELSGSAIKEIVFNAAYMAAAEHGAIGNRHIIEALKLNFGKFGKTLTREELGYLGS